MEKSNHGIFVERKEERTIIINLLSLKTQSLRHNKGFNLSRSCSVSLLGFHSTLPAEIITDTGVRKS